jgi:hypothetical protein
LLLADVALHAAQALATAEELDTALRPAFFCGARPIGLLHEVLDVAASCRAVHMGALDRAWTRGGRGRR